MDLFDEVKKYLPTYLSPKSQSELYDGLRQFPDNLHSRFYSNHFTKAETLYQGDGISDLPTIRLPQEEVVEAPVLLISNTCDMSRDNPRPLPARMLYCPIIKVKKYTKVLRKAKFYGSEEALEAHLSSVRQQRKTQFFYLPECGEMEESIALLDRVNNCDVRVVEPREIQGRRIFSLSNLGLYIFLVKISIHMTRIMERVDRR